MGDFFSIVASILTIIASIVSIGVAFYSSANTIQKNNDSILGDFRAGSSLKNSRSRLEVDSDIIVSSLKEEYFSYKRSKFYILIGVLLFSIFNIIVVYAGYGDMYFISRVVDYFINRAIFSGYFFRNLFPFVLVLYSSWFLLSNILSIYYDSKLDGLIKNIGYSKNNKFLGIVRTKLLDSEFFSNEIFPYGTIGRAIENNDIDYENKKIKDISKRSNYKYFYHSKGFFNPLFHLLIMWVLNFIFIDHKIDILKVELKEESRFLDNGQVVEKSDDLRILNYSNEGDYYVILKGKDLAKIAKNDFNLINFNEPFRSFTKEAEVINDITPLHITPFFSEDSVDRWLPMWSPVKVHKSTSLATEWVLVLTDDRKEGFVHRSFIHINQ